MKKYVGRTDIVKKIAIYIRLGKLSIILQIYLGEIKTCLCCMWGLFFGRGLQQIMGQIAYHVLNLSKKAK